MRSCPHEKSLRSARRTRGRVACTVIRVCTCVSSMVLSSSARVHACAGMTSVTGGPVHNPDGGSVPLARQICLGPHVDGYSRLPGAVRRPGGAPFEDTPVRTLRPLVRDDIPGSRNLGSRDYWVRVPELGERGSFP
jgi:hypothetical protein